ncbi:MAG: YybH family protein [Acidiferrobacterales bacterium]
MKLTSPEEAEAAFYAAFEHTDVDAMMAVWADDQDIVCIHPHGPMLVGRRAIKQSWRAIFEHSFGMKFSIGGQLLTQSGSVAVHLVYEHIQLVGDEQQRHTVIATNAYRLTDAGWCMILHHASPAPDADEIPRAALH